MNIKIIPRKLCGVIDAIPSKSHGHRILIAQKLAQIQGQSRPGGLALPAFSQDISATKHCLVQLDKDMPFLDCKESGSTLRFLLPVVMALKGEAVFIGAGKLPERPLSPLKEEMERHGCRFSMGSKEQKISQKYKEICRIRGRLQPGDYRLAGNVSSQFISGLLLALPILEGDSRLEVTTKLESAGYVDLTLAVLKSFGIQITCARSAEGFPIYHIPGGQRYEEPANLRIEGDWSNAAFWLACGALGGDITCRGLNPASPQRDKEILPILKAMGAKIAVQRTAGPADSTGEPARAEESDAPKASKTFVPANDSVGDSEDSEGSEDFSIGYAVASDPLDGSASPSTLIRCTGGKLRAAEISVAQIPDLVPALATVMAIAGGASMITDAERLKIKESDRLRTVSDFLLKLGADITYGGSGLSVTGLPELQGGEVNGHNDHRIVMAAAAASCACREPVIIRGAEAVNKSYPGFFEDFAALGGEVYEL